MNTEWHRAADAVPRQLRSVAVVEISATNRPKWIGRKVHQCCRNIPVGPSVWGLPAGGRMGENAGTGAGTRDPPCCFCTSRQRNRDLACALQVCGACLTPVALCLDLCVMVYPGKHRAQVGISFLGEWGEFCVAQGWAQAGEPSRAGKSRCVLGSSWGEWGPSQVVWVG